MNTSGDAAEQIVRLSLEGAEVVLKLTGSAAKNLAAMLYAISKDPKYPKAGKAKIAAMLKTQKPMTAYTIKQSEAGEFCKRAKEYGITYCPIAYKKTDGTLDVLIFESDAARANRIVERFKLSTVDAASIRSEIQQAKGERSASAGDKEQAAPGTEGKAPDAPEKGQPVKSREDQLLDEMLGAPIKKEDPAPANPTAARTEKSPPSEPTSEKPEKAAGGAAKRQERPSVRGELREIQSRRRQEAAASTPDKAPEKAQEKSKKPANTQTQHRQPSKKKKKPKSKAR